MEFDYADRSHHEAFDELCIDYGKRIKILTQDCPALRLLFDRFTDSGVVGDDLTRRMALALEIKLGFLHAHYDLSELAGLDNRHLAPDEQRARYRPLEDVDSFVVAMRRSRAAFALITRIRSIWDKVFLYIYLDQRGEDALKRFQGKRSRRKAFFNEFQGGFGTVSPEHLNRAKEDIERLESEFRTPELHNHGTIRTWVFKTSTKWEPRHTWMIIGHWTILSRFLHEVFRECSTSRSSFDDR